MVGPISSSFAAWILSKISTKRESQSFPILFPQEGEIEVACWVLLSEYKDMINGRGGGQGHPMMKHVIDIFEAGRKVEKKVVPSVVPGRKPNAIYLPKSE